MNICSICQQENNCKVTTPSHCWCMTTDIPKEMLTLFENTSAARVCFCMQCVTIFKQNPEMIHSLIDSNSSS